MSRAESGSAGRPVSITIDQLLALNAEIAALVRAGVPLERGLVVAGRDLRGPAGRDRDGPVAAAQPRREPGRGAGGRGASRSLRFTARSSRPAHGRASCRSRSRAWRSTCADTPRPAPPSGWLSGIPSWCWPWRTPCSSGFVCAGRAASSSTPIESLGLPVAAPLRWLSWVGRVGALLVAGRTDRALRALRSPGCGRARRRGFRRGRGAGCGSFPG